MSEQIKTSTTKNVPWVTTYVQSRIYPPPTPLIKVELYELHTTHIINVKMRRNTSQAISETYNINMSTFDDGQPEEFLAQLKNFEIRIGGTGTTMPTGRIKYLCTMIHGQSPR